MAGKILLLLLSVVLFGVLLASAGIDWYIVYLLNRDTVDYGLIRTYALGTGLTLIILSALILALIITAGIFGVGLRAIFSKSGVYTFLVLILLIVAGGLNLAICPQAKALADNPDANTVADPESELGQSKHKVLVFAIASAGLGTGIIAVSLFYYAFRGFIASKKSKK